MTDDRIAALTQAVDALTARVRHLEDCEEIRRLLYAYARGVDRVDEDLLDPCYHDDSYDSHGNWEGDKRQVVDLLVSRGRATATWKSTHHLGNILIDLKGDVAQVETYFVAYQWQERPEGRFTRTRTGRYLDRMERRDGRWRVADRRVVDDWSRLDPVVATSPDADMNTATSARDRSDASYRVLEGFMAGWRD